MARPKRYETNAAKQRAYRERQRVTKPAVTKQLGLAVLSPTDAHVACDAQPVFQSPESAALIPGSAEWVESEWAKIKAGR